MQPKTQKIYRRVLAWIGFSFLWLLMPAVIIWALYNLAAGSTARVPSADVRPEAFYQQTQATSLVSIVN